MFIVGEWDCTWHNFPLSAGVRTMRVATANKPTHLYQITNRINGKKYIGVTCKRPASRFAAHFASAKRHAQPNSTMQKAMRKYGRDAFKMEVLRTFRTYQAALRAECRAIAKLCPEYNCTEGGDGIVGYRHTDAWRAARSAATKGQPGRFKGKRHTLESKQRMSASLKGKPAFWKGRNLPAHVIESVRRGYALWRLANPDRRPVEAHEANRRAVCCLNDGIVFESITLAARHYACNTSSIAEVCGKKGPRKTVAGRVFRYADEPHGGKHEAETVRKEARIAQFRFRVPGGYRRAVVCVDDGRKFATVKEASAHYQVPAWTITKICRGEPEGKRGPKRANGLRFQFAEQTDGISLAR